MGLYLEVPANSTSQTHSLCSDENKVSGQSQEHYVCTSCGSEEYADIDAAKNRSVEDHAVLAYGKDALVCLNEAETPENKPSSTT